MKIGYVVAASAAALCTVVPVGYTAAQDQDQEERQITLVGCVMRESQYRDMYGPGLSGPRGAGIGGRNEFMLVDAHELTPGASIPSETAACPPAPGTFPTAYELTGSREGEVQPFLGRRVEITGIQKEANARPVGTSGILRPTGGFDPLGHELHLFEVEIEGVREATFARAEAPAPAAPAEVPAAPAPEPEVAAAPPAEVEAAPPAPEPAPAIAAAPEQQREVEPAPQVARSELPRTASPIPLAGLIGLLSLAGAAGMRALRRRR